MADDLTVRNQDELDRVLNNLDTLAPERTLVFAPRDPTALNRTQFTLSRTIPNPIRVDEGAHVNTDAEGLSVTVNGGKFESPFTPQLNVHVEGGNATVPRGSKVRAIDGTVHIHGGKITNHDTDIELRGKAQANTNSGTVRAFDESYVYADGTADVRGFNRARIDTFAAATFRADDQTTVRAHGSGKGHAHGTSLVHCNDANNDITWVSPDAQVNAIDGMQLHVSDDVPASRLSAATLNAPNANWERVSPFEANMADHRDIIKVSAANAAHGDLVRSAEDNPDVREILDNAPEHLKKELRDAFNEGYTKEQERIGVTSPDEKAVAPYGHPSHDKQLVYVDENGDRHYQPVGDVTQVGTLIDSETGDDMELVGWADHDGGDVRTDDMDLVYTDSAGNTHRQSWRDLEESGTLIDPETGDDMELDSVASVDDKADAMYQEYLADKAEVSETGTLTYRELIADAEKHSEPFIDDETPDGHFGVTVKNISGISTYWLKGPKGDLDAVVVGRNQDGNNYRGGGVLGGEYINRGVSPRYPITEKAAVIPNHDISDDDQKTIELDAVEGVRPEGTVIAMPDDILLEVGYKDGNPNTLRTFDWEKKKWNRSMSVAAGPGKALLGELENMSPEARKVPENVASAYGHCTGSCLMCGRGLKSTSSLSAGYGPECKGKLR